MDKLSVLVLALIAGQAFASPIAGTSGSAAPAIAGRTGVVTFDSDARGTYSTLTSGGVTVSGVGGTFRVANDYAGQYNGRGTNYIDNNQGATSTLRFDFASLVDAFAFNWGASDVAWTLNAFDAAGTLLESLVTPTTGGSNAGDYVGLADVGIRYATLTSSEASARDWVFVDNLAVSAAAVPEPASFALLGPGLVGLVALRRRDGRGSQRRAVLAPMPAMA